MKKLNIHQVHSVWQHGKDDQEDDGDHEDDVDPAIPKEHVYGNVPQVPMQDHSTMSPQNLSGFQALQEFIQTMNLNMNRRFNNIDTHFDNMDRIDEIQKQIKDFHDSFE